LSVREPDSETPEFVKQAGRDAIDRGLTHYSPATGFDHLRKAVADKLRRDNGIVCDSESEVLITPGSSSGIFLALLALTEPGDEVLVQDPAWFHYTTLIELCGAKAVGVPAELGVNPGLDQGEAEKRITKRTKLLILNSPSNPTGLVLSKPNIEALGELAEKYDLWVISDEVYEKIIYDNNTHLSPASLASFQGRTITSNGFSKAYAMTGWRVGYLAGPSTVVEKMTGLNGYIQVCASSIAQQAAYTALADRRMDAEVKRMVERYVARRRMVLDALTGLPGVAAFPPQGAFYTWIDVSAKGLPSTDFARRLMDRERIGVLPGNLFGMRGEGFIRISFAVNDEKLKTGLERLRRFLQQDA
jgi:aspartate/methionine/tyrosine aminotransferase